MKELLANRQANGIIFTTMQKFEEAFSERRNIIVMADEAHRGQYGLTEKVVVKQKENGDLEAKTIIGTSQNYQRQLVKRYLYRIYRHSDFLRKTEAPVKCSVITLNIYDTTQTVEDGATRPVYYESRVIHLKLDENTLHLIDTEYDIMAAIMHDPEVIEKSKKELGQMEADSWCNDKTIQLSG